MMLYLFILLKSLILEIRFINIQPDTLTFTDLIPVEQLLKKFRSSFKFISEQHQKCPTFNICKRVINAFLRVRQDAT